MERRLIDLPFWESKNGRRKLIDISENLAAILSPLSRSEGSVKPKRRFDLEARLKDDFQIPWPHNVLRHSFCSNAVAIKGLMWTAETSGPLGDDAEEALLGGRR